MRTADQRVNCGHGPQVWSAVYPLVGPQVRILPVPDSGAVTESHVALRKQHSAGTTKLNNLDLCV